MESWEGHNYLTGANSKWVELMNLSTAEWNMGWLPPNVVAIPGALNDTYNFPLDTFVIQYASMSQIGPDNIEAVVFGVCSAIAWVWALAWLAWGVKDKSLLKPRAWARLASGGRTGRGSNDVHLGHYQNAPPISGEDGDGIASGSGSGIDLVEGEFYAADFEKRLDRYYPRFASYSEVYERDAKTGALEADEVTAASELLVRMLRNDSKLRALQRATGVGADEMDRLRAESDAMLAEVRRRVTAWSVKGLNEGERTDLKGMVTALARHQPPRYRHREAEWTQIDV